jgi:hypothetical protein
MGFWKDIRQAISEGVAEAREENAAEAAAAEAEAATDDETKRAAAEAEMRRTLDERVAFISGDEKFALCLAAPFRILIFFDWFTVWKDTDWKSTGKYLCPLHLYTFGDGVDVSDKNITEMVRRLKSDFGIKDKDSVVNVVKSLMFAADMPVNSPEFRPKAGYTDINEDGVENFLSPLHNTEDPDRFTSIRVLLSVITAFILTSAADVGYITKSEAMEVLPDVNIFAKSLLPEGDWPLFAENFLAGELAVGLNRGKGRQTLEKFTGYLLSKPGSPWSNIPFHAYGEELLSGDELKYGYLPAPILYDKEELDVLEAHIEKYFGEFENVFHETFSPDVHLDAAIIQPSAGRFRKLLVTMGAGAYKMNIPEEIADRNLERMELVTVLPPNWDINSGNDEDYWPIGTTEAMGRYSINHNTWLGWGHSVQFGESASVPGTDFVGYVLDTPRGFPADADICLLPDGTEINFYQIIPVYDSEMEYKRKNGMEALQEKFTEAFGEDWDGMIQPHREAAV